MSIPGDLQAERAAVLAARLDHAQFAQIYVQHVSSVQDFVLGQCGDRQLADDVVAAAFTRALERIDTWLPSRGYSTLDWIQRFARIELLKAWLASNPGWSHRFPLFAPASLSYTERNDCPDWEIAGLTAGLPDGFREVIQALYFEGKTIPEVAAELNRTEGWVRKNHRCGLWQLRRSLTLQPPWRPLTKNEPMRTVVPVD